MRLLSINIDMSILLDIHEKTEKFFFQ